MAGYYGYSMSNNAVAAYDDGERPLSKWSKKEILSACEEYTELNLSKLTVSELKQYMLISCGWHHTSKFYNKTNFYGLDVDYIEKLTQEDVDTIIIKRPAKATKTPEQLELEKIQKAIANSQKEARKKEKERKAHLEKLFKYQLNYKRLNMFISRVSEENIKKLEEFRIKTIKEKREELRDIWMRQNYKYGLDRIEDDEFIEYYACKAIRF